MTDTIPTIQSAEDYVAAVEEIAALIAQAHEPKLAARLALLSMKVKLFQAKIYGRLRENLSDTSCWLHVRHPDWHGGFHVKAPPGPAPRFLGHITVWEQERDEVRPAIWYDLLRALAALGYNPDGPEPAWTWRVVRPLALARMSAHRRIEGVARVQAAVAASTGSVAQMG